jgi:7-cyano-7-deazaguanine synthase
METAARASSDRALVLFSGGQDSTTCLAWALARYAHVETVGFDYGQRHVIELACRATLRESLARDYPDWASRLGQDHTIDLRVLGTLSDTALTQDVAIRLLDSGLPNTFVPGRNLLFFNFAAVLGYRRGLTQLVGGMCETDYSGYPDCRDETLRALEDAIKLGTASRFALVTPLMWLDKRATWALADELGGDRLVELIVEHTHTCYLGERGTRHDWGYGCGRCPACTLRARGWQQWRSGATPR